MRATQSLFGYSLVASLFISFGAGGWTAFAAPISAALFVMWMVNLSGAAGERYGIPYPVFARASLGTEGAKLPAILRATVAVFWYGVQVYFASTAVALLIRSISGADGGGGTEFLGLAGIDWLSFVIVWAFHIVIFWRGMSWVETFLNIAGPFVYLVMIGLVIVLWQRSEGRLLSATATIFANPDGTLLTELTGFVATGGAAVVFGEEIINPTEIVERTDSVLLGVVAAVTFFAATVGINLVANFIPAVNGIANLAPEKISFRRAGLITSLFALAIGGFWNSFISEFGISGFVNTLGAVLAPIFGIMIVDYHLHRKQYLDVDDLYDETGGRYHYRSGWNGAAVKAFGLAAIFSVATVWAPWFAFLSGYNWIIGAALGGVIYHVLHRERVTS